jgi:hypothetical protein
VNIDIKTLNNILKLHTAAFRIEELNSKVFPLYKKFKIKPDVHTFKDLSIMYLKLKEYDTVKNLYKKLKKDTSIKPNQMYS